MADEHQWIVSVTYVITPAQAEELTATKRITLPEDFAVLGPICYHCECLYEDAPARCAGDASADTVVEERTA